MLSFGDSGGRRLPGQASIQGGLKEKEEKGRRHNMPRYKDETPAVRVYTVCDESRLPLCAQNSLNHPYLIVRNVPALGCGDDLLKLFSSHGDIEDFKPMDAEDCEQFTDVYWVKFRLVSNARFAKRKLDEFVFLGNRLQVSYAPQFETLSDTKDKLEGRRKEVLARLNPGRSKGPKVHNQGIAAEASLLAVPLQTDCLSQPVNSMQYRESGLPQHRTLMNNAPTARVSSDLDYFPSESMNQTVRVVREKLNKIQSSTDHLPAAPPSKKARPDNRRRI